MAVPADPSSARARLRVSAAVLAWVFVAALVAFGVLTALVVADAQPGLDEGVQEAAVDAESDSIAWLADGPFEEIADPTYMTPVALGVALVMAALRWWVAAVVVLLGLALTAFAGSELKDIIGRERPVDRISASSNEAYPSGHSRFSVLWTVFAVAIAVYVPLRARVRRALLAAGVTLTVIAGLSRVYLRAHWLTDVLGGWSFSVLAFSGAALLGIAAFGRPARRYR